MEGGRLGDKGDGMWETREMEGERLGRWKVEDWETRKMEGGREKGTMSVSETR